MPRNKGCDAHGASEIEMGQAVCFMQCEWNCLSGMTSVCDASASGFSDGGCQWGQLETQPRTAVGNTRVSVLDIQVIYHNICPGNKGSNAQRLSSLVNQILFEALSARDSFYVWYKVV